MNSKGSLLFAVLSVCVMCLVITVQTGFCQEMDTYTSSNPKGCNLCHKPEAKLWLDHGHSKMLRPVVGGKAPKGVKVKPPAGMKWDDISYLVGGDKNYARFVDSKGYVVTGEGANWSLDGKTNTAFMPDVTKGTKKYGDCIRCHSVGYMPSGSYIKGVKNDLEGIEGVWFESGVGCEACHGPGHEHAALGPKKMKDMKKKDKKADLKIQVNKKSDLCGQCHKRNSDDKINVVSPTLVESRQQFSEMKYNKHTKFKVTCIFCHNPHGKSTEKEGFKRTCLDCHKGKFAKPVKIAAMKSLSCEQCHMPLAVRGAFGSMAKGYNKGDTRSHIFGISTDGNYKLDDGSGHATLNKDGYARLTVEMTCYSCHQSGMASEKSRDVLLAHAKEIH
ncbi:multiheme c-type cytochrome [Candidatus Omnitrophota bacterium]